MGKIILVLCEEKNKKTGMMEKIVSHGIDAESGKKVCLPCETPSYLGAQWDSVLAAWVLL